jgi:hypothetical protein
VAIVHTGKGRRNLGKDNSEVIELYYKDWGAVSQSSSAMAGR